MRRDTMMAMTAGISEPLISAEIISIGTELLLGEITDTNASWLASQLPAVGFGVVQPGSYEARMHDRWRCDELDTLIADRATVQVVEESLAAAKQDGHERQVHLVDRAGA